jgi:AhpD family alkylhydroperoxidase
MSDQKVSNAFQLFLEKAPAAAQAWMRMVDELSRASALDEKTRHLAYLAVLAAVGMTSGVPFHVGLARKAGATREEIVSAILVGLPAVGHGVTQALPGAMQALEE